MQHLTDCGARHDADLERLQYKDVDKAGYQTGMLKWAAMRQMQQVQVFKQCPLVLPQSLHILAVPFRSDRLPLSLPEGLLLCEFGLTLC